MPTIKLTIEYDGTAYAGWQRQPDQPTIQASLEAALCKISGAAISTVAAGRTDAGVHALGQVVSYRTDKTLTPLQWTRALNAVLPEDICIRSAELAADTFHARRSARRKCYEYRILNRPERAALNRQRAWHIYGALDLEAMQAGAALLVGRQDFSSFEGPHAESDSRTCDVQRVDVRRDSELVRVEIEADRFLKQMVRAIVGTLVEIGQDKRSAQSITNILAARDRRAAGYTAPPQGLYLIRVEY